MSTLIRLTAIAVMTLAATTAVAAPAAAGPAPLDPPGVACPTSTDQIVGQLQDQGFGHPAANQFARFIRNDCAAAR